MLFLLKSDRNNAELAVGNPRVRIPNTSDSVGESPVMKSSRSQTGAT